MIFFPQCTVETFFTVFPVKRSNIKLFLNHYIFPNLQKLGGGGYIHSFFKNHMIIVIFELLLKTILKFYFERIINLSINPCQRSSSRHSSGHSTSSRETTRPESLPWTRSKLRGRTSRSLMIQSQDIRLPSMMFQEPCRCQSSVSSRRGIEDSEIAPQEPHQGRRSQRPPPAKGIHCLSVQWLTFLEMVA